MAKHQPATPLPWVAAAASPDYEPLQSAVRPQGDWMLRYTTSDDGIHFDKRDVDYIAHTANAYPRLVEALRKAQEALALHHFRSDGYEEYNNDEVIEADTDCVALLRELGEV